MKKHFLRFIFPLLLFIISLFSFIPIARADQSDNDLMGKIISILHLNTTKESGLFEKPEIFDNEKRRSKISSDPELQVSLSDKLGLFFSVNMRSAIRDINNLYEKSNSENYRALFGINIAF